MKEPIPVGARVRMRRSGALGTVERVADLGLKMAWDLGIAKLDRPQYVAPGEVERVTDE